MMKHRHPTTSSSSSTSTPAVASAAGASTSEVPEVVRSTTTTTTTTRRVRTKGFQNKPGFGRFYGRSSSSSRTPASDILIAIGATFVLTSVAIISILKIISSPQHDDYQMMNHNIFRDDAHQGHDNKNYGFHNGALEDLDVLDWNPMYRIPDSMDVVGDRSDRYIQLRKQYDLSILPEDHDRSLSHLLELQEHSAYSNLPVVPIPVTHSDTVPYNIYDCPENPPAGYPFQWNLLDIIQNWNPDNVTVPTNSQIHQGLCVFDYNIDYTKALNYQKAEVPFVTMNDPQVARTVERWNSPGYLSKLLGSTAHRCEHSQNNHFMYFTPVSHNQQKKRNRRRIAKNKPRLVAPEGWTEPTKLIRMPFEEWIHHANVTDEFLGPDQPHWYFRLIGCGAMGNDGSCDKGSSEYLFDELPFFQPRASSLYVVEPDEQKGIHCRFGMKGVIAENHFDASRNSIVVLGGSRRYILSHPNQCTNLALYPKGHPSARHSAVDWSNPDLDEYPEFKQATANEVVLLPGHVLYLPTDWFHFIVSLELNYQCNTRSGVTDDYKEDLRECGF